MSIKHWLQNAFAVESAELPPTDREIAIVDRICREVVKRQMTVPAITFLEMVRPLNYLASQTMHFFQPFLTVLVNADEYQIFAQFLERRDSVDLINERLEAMEKAAEQIERASDKTRNGGDRDE